MLVNEMETKVMDSSFLAGALFMPDVNADKL